MNLNFQDKSILIVEDDPISALLFKELLEPTQAKLTVVYDGNSLFEVIRNHAIDLILLDIRLGDQNGFQLLPKIREINPNIIVIAQTANAFLDNRVKCMEAGFDEYISKPVSSEELFYKLTKFLLPQQ